MATFEQKGYGRKKRLTRNQPSSSADTPKNGMHEINEKFRYVSIYIMDFYEM